MTLGQRKLPAPDMAGPVWDAFVDYWKTARDSASSRASAWRAFHAAWMSREPFNNPLVGHLSPAQLRVLRENGFLP